MSDLTFNKVAGAVLATGLAVFGLKPVSEGLFAPHEVEKPGYLVEVVEEGGAGAAPEAPIDWGTVLPTADIAAGQATFAKCQSCHTFASGGANGTGPNLFGVVGRKPASHGGFAYSPAMTAKSVEIPVWDDAHLSEFIKAPQRYVSGTKMTFVGLKKPEERINMIAFLRSQGGTLPVPAPNPAPPPPAEGAAPEGAAPEGAPVATGSTATPPTTSGGPAGQGVGAPAPGAPAQQATPPGKAH